MRILFFLLLPFCLFAKKTICLNMIVKDESPVILDCLKSVKPMIDYWVIVDTGSTDGTQKIISDFLKSIPGELHERPWVGFSHNRNEAIQLAKSKADYLLFIDADEYFTFTDDFKLPTFDQDYYYATVFTGAYDYFRITLASTKFDWKYEGVLHEIIRTTETEKYDLWRGIRNSSVPNRGNRSKDPQKYQKDAKLLEEGLVQEPNNTRYLFHLAQTYINAGDPELGLKTYQRRVDMGGFAEEVFFSLVQIARLQEALKRLEAVIIAGYQKAFAYRPTRAEPLHYLSNYYLAQKNYEAAYKEAKRAIAISQPMDSVLVEGSIYDWAALYTFINCCFHLNKYKEMQVAMEKLLLAQTLPENLRQETEKNLTILRKR